MAEADDATGITYAVAFQWVEVTGGDNGVVGVWPSRWAASREIYYYLALTVSASLAPVIVEQMADAVRRMKAEGISVVLSEQNLTFAAAVADRTYIIEKGAIRHEGRMSEIETNPALRETYLAA